METALKRLENTIALLELNPACAKQAIAWLKTDLKLIRAFVPTEGE